MPFEIENEYLNGVKVIVPRVFYDNRGYFTEAYRKDSFSDLGISHDFLQDNHSLSMRGVIRGLHFQWDAPMAKLMRVTQGRVFLVSVDIRKGSPTLGQWVGVEVSAENKRQVFALPGFARGFCVLSDVAELQYKCSAIWNPKAEGSIRWDDPDIGIEWPVDKPIMSQKDVEGMSLQEWLASPESEYFRYA
jgi:dTDP-4-dehydrorhamnose 3,5-epimerase